MCGTPQCPTAFIQVELDCLVLCPHMCSSVNVFTLFYYQHRLKTRQEGRGKAALSQMLHS